MLGVRQPSSVSVLSASTGVAVRLSSNLVSGVSGVAVRGEGSSSCLASLLAISSPGIHNLAAAVQSRRRAGFASRLSRSSCSRTASNETSTLECCKPEGLKDGGSELHLCWSPFLRGARGSSMEMNVFLTVHAASLPHAGAQVSSPGIAPT
jgi:hypothetical protein